MALLAPNALAVRFRSLSFAERRAFLASVWAERGHETRVLDGVVVANDGAAAKRVAVAGEFTWSLPPDVDVVVGTRDRPRIRRLAADADADFLSPADLRDLLAYGIERDRAEPIAREHLGTSLTVPDPNPPPRLPNGAAPALILVLVLGVSLLVLPGAGALPAVGPFVADDPSASESIDGAGDASSPSASDEPGADDPGGSGPTASDGTDATDATEGESGHSPYPPGTDADGVVDAATLIETHRELFDGMERAYWLEYEGPATTPWFGDRNAVRADAWIHSSSRFLVEMDGVRATSDDGEGDGEATVREEHWADGDRTHSRILENDTDRTSSAPVDERRVAPLLEDRAQYALFAALAAGETTTERDDWRGWRLVQVSGTAEEVRIGGEEYRNVILTSTFTSDGELIGFRMEHVHGPTGEPARLTFQYRPTEEVPPPEPPEWYDEHADGGSHETDGGSVRAGSATSGTR